MTDKMQAIIEKIRETPLPEQSTNSHILRKPADRVRVFGAALYGLLDSLAETAKEQGGYGLAAPQVGVSLRVAVVLFDSQRLELINPEIIKARGSEIGQEGCLSIPGIVADVERATYILFRNCDRMGREYRIKAYNHLARIVQHEIDHLNGVLIVDKALRINWLQ